LHVRLRIDFSLCSHRLSPPLREISPSVIPNSTKIFVNGAWVGIHRDPELLVRTLRQLRRQVDVNTEVGVMRDIRLKELRLYTDYGRCCRPLFIVENQKLLIKKQGLQLWRGRTNDEVRQDWKLKGGGS
jgi:DNA-directed RNA polymerase II subunit RPB2